jgi:hypothetical protein
VRILENHARHGNGRLAQFENTTLTGKDGSEDSTVTAIAIKVL